MKKVSKSLKDVLGLVALVALTLGLVWLFGAVKEGAPVGQQMSPIRTPTPEPPPRPSPTPQRTRAFAPVTPTPVPPTPTPLTPVPRTPVGTPPTATPYPGEIRPPAVFVTPTPRPISKVTDLASDLSEQDKAKVIVQHPDGTFEAFLIRYEMDLSELPLEPEDVIINLVPPSSLMGHRRPRVTPLRP